MYKFTLRCAFLISLIIVSVVLLNGCEEKKIIKIGFFNMHEEGSDMWKSYEKKIKNQEKKINDFLSSEVNYEVEFEVLSSYAPIESYSDFDLVEGPRTFTSTELSENFRDLSSELSSGNLKILYESLPDGFWNTVTVNDHIYSISRYIPNNVMCLEVSASLIDSCDLTVPSELIGKPINEWETFFSELYEKNEHRAFLENPFYNSFYSPILAGNVWEANYQLLSTGVGIYINNISDGVVCIYESTYAEEMKQIWMKFNDLGYVISREDYEDNYEWFANNSIRVYGGFDTKSVESLKNTYIYPLQNYINNVPMHTCYKQYWQVIPKNGKNFGDLCDFLCRISSDREVLKNVCLNNEGQPVVYLTEAASCLGDPGAELVDDYNTNLEKYGDRINSINDTEISGFIFNPENVEAEIISNQLVQEKYAEYLTIMLDTDNWVEWDKYMDEMIKELYDAGLQKILDEANSQLDSYLSE